MRCQEYRSEKGLTQAALAERARVSQSIISRIESGGDASGRNWARLMLATGGQVKPTDHFIDELVA